MTEEMDRMRIADTYRQEIIDWLALNGINASDVPAGARASVADGKLTIDLWKRINGKLQWDLNDPLRMLSEAVTVPLEVPPTPEVEHWLQPTCPTCGR